MEKCVLQVCSILIEITVLINLYHQIRVFLFALNTIIRVHYLLLLCTVKFLNIMKPFCEY